MGNIMNPKYDDAYWAKRFTDEDDPRIVKAVKILYSSFPPKCMPQGVCDPMYIGNLIARELGVGDGQGTFNLPVIDGSRS